MFIECKYEFVNTSSVCLHVEKHNNNIWDIILGVILEEQYVWLLQSVIIIQ